MLQYTYREGVFVCRGIDDYYVINEKGERNYIRYVKKFLGEERGYYDENKWCVVVSSECE